MLNRTTASAVYDLAQQVTQNNLALIPTDESPLTALINASISPSMAAGHQVPYTDSNLDEESPLTFLGASRLKSLEGASEHDLVMDELIESVSEAVSRNLNWAHNDVVPMIDMVAEQAAKDVAEASIQGVQPYTIVPFFYAELWDRPEIQAMAEKYSVIPKQAVRLTAVVPLPDGKSVKELLVTGMLGIDESIRNLIDRHGEGWAEEVYNGLFGKNRAASLDDFMSMRYAQIDDTLLGMLLANAMEQNVPDGLNMSLDGYRSYMSGILSQLGSQANRILARRNYNTKEKVLVLERPSRIVQTGHLIVNGDVYNAWLADGGTPEMLMGSIIAGRPDDYHSVMRDGAANMASYRGIAEQLKSETGYQRLSALIKSFRKSMTDIIENMEENDLPVAKTILHANLAYRLSRLKQHDLNDVVHAARKVVCRTLWHHTDAEKFIDAIDISCRAHPDLPVREAVMLASADIVVEWLVGQLTLAPAK